MTKPAKGVARAMSEGVISHHEVMYKLEILEMERGAQRPYLVRVWAARADRWTACLHSPGHKVSGHRGYFLTGDGVDLNHALIAYGLNFLRERGFKKLQPPFFMNKATMAKTAQLSEFDEALYKLEGDGDENEKYLIATSEQPISAAAEDVAGPFWSFYGDERLDEVITLRGEAPRVRRRVG